MLWVSFFFFYFFSSNTMEHDGDDDQDNGVHVERNEMPEEHDDVHQGRDFWYNTWELHMDSLNQIIREIRRDEIGRTVSGAQLQVRKERFQSIFGEFERAHLTYVQFVILASGQVCVIMERHYINALTAIVGRLAELNEGLNGSIGSTDSALVLGWPQMSAGQLFV